MTRAIDILGGPAVPGIELTPQQREILRFIAGGCTTKEIADRLSISARTAQWHVSRLMAIFDVPNRAALVHAAESHGLLDEIDEIEAER